MADTPSDTDTPPERLDQRVSRQVGDSVRNAAAQVDGTIGELGDTARKLAEKGGERTQSKTGLLVDSVRAVSNTGRNLMDRALPGNGGNHTVTASHPAATSVAEEMGPQRAAHAHARCCGAEGPRSLQVRQMEAAAADTGLQR